MNKSIKLHYEDHLLGYKEDEFRLLVERVTDYAIIMIDTEGRIKTWNDGAKQIKGYDAMEIIGEHISIYYPKEDKENGVAGQNLEKAKELGSFKEEGWLVRKDGTLFWADRILTAIFNKESQLTGFLKIVKDITDQKKMKDDLLHQVKEKNSALTQLFERNTDVFVAFDLNWNYTYVNKKAAEINGRLPEEMIGKNLWLEFPEKKGYEIYNFFFKAMEEQKILHVEGFHPSWKMWFNAMLYPSPEGLTVCLQDVTEKKKVELMLEESREKHRQIVETAQEGVWMVNEENYTSFVNQKLADILEYEPREMMGKSLFDFMDEEARLQAVKNIERRKQGINEHMEFRYITKNGRSVWTHISTNPIFDDKGNYKGALAMVTDITDRKEALDKLKQSEEKYRLIVQAAQEGIWTIDENKITNFVNNKLCEILEYSPEEMLGKSVLQFMNDEGAELASKVINEKEIQVNYESNDFITKSGRTIWVSISTNPIFGENSEYKGALAMITDITERKKAETELNELNEQLRNLSAHLQTVREEERTSIAREVHDELGQQMTSLKMDIAALKDKYEKELPDIGSKTDSMLEMVNEAIRSVRRIVIALRPGILDDLGLEAAIEWQAKEFEQRTGIACILNSSLHREKFSPDINITVFRIFQESLTNVMRHAYATVVKVNLYEEHTMLLLEINDNGIGISDERQNNRTSFGLLGMKERALMIKGNLDIIRLAEGGTKINLKIPL